MSSANPNICAIILAGGESRRMKGIDKPTIKLGTQPLIEHVLNRIAPQVSTCLISCNGDNSRFDSFGLQCISDTHQPPRGPLEGILTALDELNRSASQANWLLAVPADCPFMPTDLAKQLLARASKAGSDVAFACYKGKEHYLCSLWSTRLSKDIAAYLNGDHYSVRGLLKKLGAAQQAFDDATYDPFFNINTPADLQEAETKLNT